MTCRAGCSLFSTAAAAAAAAGDDAESVAKEASCQATVQTDAGALIVRIYAHCLIGCRSACTSKRTLMIFHIT